MRCLNCKYRLRNLPKGGCPECRHPFDPENPRTFYVEDGPPFPGRELLTTGIIGVASGLAAFACLFSWSAPFAALFALPVSLSIPTIIWLNWYLSSRPFRSE